MGSEAQDRQRRGTRQLLIGRVCFIVTSYASTIIIARALGPADYGLYGVILSVLVWLEMLAGAGLPAATGKLIPLSPTTKPLVESSARFLHLGVGLGLFILCWSTAPAIVRLFNIPDGTVLFRLAIVDIPFAALYIAHQGILTGNRRFGSLAAAQMIYGGAKLVGITLLLLIDLTVAGVLIVNVLATCATLVFLRVHVPAPGLRLNPAIARQLISLAVPMGAFLVALQVVQNVPLWGLQVLWGGEEETIGHFVAALQISKMLTIIPTVQSGVLFASVGWALARDDEEAARHHLLEAIRFALILVAPACVIVGGDSAPLLSLLFSEQYAGAAAFLWLQLIGFGAYALADAFSHSLMAAGRQRMVAQIFLALVPASLLAAVVLIRAVGPVGAAASLALVMLLGALAVGVVANRWFGAVVPWRTFGRVVFAAVVVGLAGSLLEVSGAWVLVKMLALGMLYLLLLRLSGEISLADFRIPEVQANSEIPRSEVG